MTEAEGASCLSGGACPKPIGGGACIECGYPRGYAHPRSLLDAFSVDAIYVDGTAMRIYDDPGIPPGVVQIVHRDGRRDDHPISTMADESGALDERTREQVIADLEAQGRRVDPAIDRACGALGHRAQTRIINVAAHLFRVAEQRQCPGSSWSIHQELAQALLDGVTALLRYGMIGDGSRLLLECITSEGIDDEFAKAVLLDVRPDVRTMLAELGRARRLRAAARAQPMLIDDRRPGVTWMAAGPFRDSFSRVRVALLPGDASHARIYDLGIGALDDYPLCRSILDRVPENRPELVREGLAIDLGSRITHRYLPGALMAGTLRSEANSSDPYRLTPRDLIGGSLIDLHERTAPLSYVYLTYEVDPGHLFCAVVEPDPS